MDITYVYVAAACASRVGVEHVWAGVKMHVTACEADGWLTPRRLERPTLGGHGRSARKNGGGRGGQVDLIQAHTPGSCMQGFWFRFRACSACAQTQNTRRSCPPARTLMGVMDATYYVVALSSGWDRRGHALLQAQSRKRHSAIGSSPQKSTGFCGARQGLASVIAAAGMGCFLFLFLASCALWLARLGLTVFSASSLGVDVSPSVTTKPCLLVPVPVPVAFPCNVDCSPDSDPAFHTACAVWDVCPVLDEPS